MMKTVPKALTIAGSDSGAGAGIQADLKTFAALRVYGSSAITAVTAQNTLGVSQVLALSPKLVGAQIDAVVGDIGADAVKTGMLANAAIIELVARKIAHYGLKNLVVDPVMVATSGDLLIERSAITALRARLIPLAALVTPNLPEAAELTGKPVRNARESAAAAKEIVGLGAKAVVIKGGHREKGPAIDLFFDGKNLLRLAAPRIRTINTHGTGCTFSAAIAAHLARGAPVDYAVRAAKSYITAAIRAGFQVGRGHGPVHHFYRFWRY